MAQMVDFESAPPLEIGVSKGNGAKLLRHCAFPLAH
jgi:hypothetical protein